MRNKKKFNEFMNKTIEELKDEKRYGTAHVYQSTLNAFCEFCGCKIVYFHQLNRATLKEFETHLRDKQLSWNTVSTYMRTLRGAYNKAVDQKITTGNSRLFNHVYTGVKNDVKRALEVEEINKLLNEVPLKRLPEDLVRCRVWANLMFQLRGMPFVDLAFLHKSLLTRFQHHGVIRPFHLHTSFHQSCRSGRLAIRPEIKLGSEYPNHVVFLHLHNKRFRLVMFHVKIKLPLRVHFPFLPCKHGRETKRRFRI